MNQNAAIALAKTDQIRTNAADRPDLLDAFLALENPDQSRNAALGQYLVYDIGLAQPRLRPCRRRVIDHNRQRPLRDRRLNRQPG